MDGKSALEELRQPHPDQARIDAESAQLLRASASMPGGHGAWMREGAVRHGRRWARQEEPVLVNSTR
jgi:hypothetical protein